jgi:hypothetical protein
MSELGPVLLFPAFGVLILLFAAGQALHRLFRASREKTAQGTVTGTWFYKGVRSSTLLMAHVTTFQTTCHRVRR